MDKRILGEVGMAQMRALALGKEHCHIKIMFCSGTSRYYFCVGDEGKGEIKDESKHFNLEME
jgi:hypothetical protein